MNIEKIIYKNAKIDARIYSLKVVIAPYRIINDLLNKKEKVNYDPKKIKDIYIKAFKEEIKMLKEDKNNISDNDFNEDKKVYDLRIKCLERKIKDIKENKYDYS